MVFQERSKALDDFVNGFRTLMGSEACLQPLVPGGHGPPSSQGQAVPDVNPDWTGRDKAFLSGSRGPVQEFGIRVQPSVEVRKLRPDSGLTMAQSSAPHQLYGSVLVPRVRNLGSETGGEVWLEKLPQEPSDLIPASAPHAPAGKVPKSQFWKGPRLAHSAPRDPCPGLPRSPGPLNTAIQERQERLCSSYFGEVQTG